LLGFVFIVDEVEVVEERGTAGPERVLDRLADGEQNLAMGLELVLPRRVTTGFTYFNYLLHLHTAFLPLPRISAINSLLQLLAFARLVGPFTLLWTVKLRK